MVLLVLTTVPAADATLSAGSLGAFAPPPRVAPLVIARDDDAEGEPDAERFARRCARARVAATVLVPEGEDFDDDLVALGRGALPARLAPDYYVVWLDDDWRGPIRVHERSRIREVAEQRIRSHPFCG